MGCLLGVSACQHWTGTFFGIFSVGTGSGAVFGHMLCIRQLSMLYLGQDP